MAGGDKNMKALREVWRRAENSLCADCGKPGEALRAGASEDGAEERTGFGL